MRPESHHHPGQETGQCGDYQQPPRSKDLLEEPPEDAHYDRGDVLQYPNETLLHGITPSLFSYDVIVMLYQDRWEISIDATDVNLLLFTYITKISTRLNAAKRMEAAIIIPE